jgi:formylglycine-generating enzyme required for sulfatase activity
LPTKQEWEFVSGDCGNYCFSNKGKNKKGMVTFNHCWAPDSIEAKAGYEAHFPDVTAPVYSYWKNNFGLFQMIGNVSEMVQEKGISKGGSWRNLFEDCRVGKDIPYEKPTAMLGFRCVCVVKKK